MRNSFALIRWPLDICLFELALGYGVSRILRTAFEPGTVPGVVSISAYALVALLSAFVVCRYMPSEVSLERNGHGSMVVVLWINLCLVLAEAIPVISVLFAESLVFWIAMVIVAAIKAVYSLEEQRRKEGVALEGDRQTAMVIPAKGFLARHVYSPAPEAFALKPAATAVLLTLSSLGFVLQYQIFNNASVEFLVLCVIGELVSCFAVTKYIGLSTAARLEAMRRAGSTS